MSKAKKKQNRPPITASRDAFNLADGQVSLLGAANSVTPAMSLVELEGMTLLVDCGADPSVGTEPVELPDAAYEADAVLLTHGHLDHVGGIPALLASGFNAPIYATAATLAVTRIVLGDMIRLRGGQHRDVRAFLGGFDLMARAVAYDEPFKPFPKRDVEVAFREAGHILGSASIEISTPASRLLFSGDLGRPSSPVLRDYNTEWDDSRPFDLVVVESTYGDRLHGQAPEDVTDALFAVIQRARRDGGHILVPAFAVGRTQAIIYHLDKLVESGRLQNLPVAVDTPMGLRVTETYEAFKMLFDEESLDKLSRNDDPLDFKGLYAVRKGRDSKKLRDVDGTMLIMAGSGMCTGGRITGHLKELLPFGETNVLFVGYQAPGTPGRAIIEAAERAKEGPSETVHIGGQDVPVRAQVDVISGLSAHADRDELTRWLDALPEVKQVVLHHGDEHAQQAFEAHYK